MKILRQNWQSYFKQPFQVLGIAEQVDFIKECVDKEVSFDDPRANPGILELVFFFFFYNLYFSQALMN